MKSKINIIIPAIEVNPELIGCFNQLNKLDYNNFFVTVVLDFHKNKLISKYKYKIKVIVTGKKNMSLKRNLAVKKNKSKYIAFLDSDAYPSRGWLKIGEKYLKEKKADIVGGPSLPFPKKNFLQSLTYFSKRSYFVTGYQSFRKYKSPARFCDWIESCNIIMERKFFLKFKGMNKNIYTGEDKEFIERIRKTMSNLKVYHCPKLYIFHKERNYFGFLLQRMTFGMDFINLVNPSVGIKGFQSLIPLAITLFYLTFFFLAYNFAEIRNEIIYLFLIFMIVTLIIFIEITKYVKPIKLIIPTIFTIILANIFFALGGILSVLGFRKNLVRSIYRKSKKT